VIPPRIALLDLADPDDIAYRVTDNEDVNSMHAANLAIIFAP
jgi:hypothetical protein